jgi:hypothetical protein
MIRVGWTRLESPFEAPVAGGIIPGMNRNRPDSGNVSSLGCSQQVIFDQGDTKNNTYTVKLNATPYPSPSRGLPTQSTHYRTISAKTASEK